jgi:hypothetical protein
MDRALLKGETRRRARTVNATPSRPQSRNNQFPHRQDASVFVLEQIAAFPDGQLMEHVFLPSSLVALQLPPSGPGADTLLLSVLMSLSAPAASLVAAVAVGLADGAGC